MAFDLPTRRVSRCVPPVPGVTPTVISSWPNFAFGAARMKVAHHRELTAAAERIAGDGGNDRLAASGDFQPLSAAELDGEDFGKGFEFRHFADVGTGGESLVVAGEHQRADARVVVEGLHRLLSSATVARDNALRTCGRLNLIRPTLPTVSLRIF
jgi:hypothetical protein